MRRTPGAAGTRVGPGWGGEAPRTWLSALPELGRFVRAGAWGSRLEPSSPRRARRQGGKEGGRDARGAAHSGGRE